MSIRFSLILLPYALWCWASMLLTHEMGHVLAAWLTGGRVTYVNVFPFVIPSTLVQPNPAPSVVLWGGFLPGWLVPQAVAWSVARTRLADSAQCWAGFCWLVGGVYLVAGGLERFADAAQLVREGWPLWLLAPVGVAAATLGYAACRRAWPRLLRQMESAAASWRHVAKAWLSLGLWCVFQWWLAAVLNATAL